MPASGILAETEYAQAQFLDSCQQLRWKSESAPYCHSRECGNPGESIPPQRETPAFAGVTDLETFYETINLISS